MRRRAKAYRVLVLPIPVPFMPVVPVPVEPGAVPLPFNQGVPAVPSPGPLFSGALPSLMAKIFPVSTRVTGMSLSYNIGVPIFGGFAPFFAQSLIDLTGSKLAPSYYMIATALLSLVALVVLYRRSKIWDDARRLRQRPPVLAQATRESRLSMPDFAGLNGRYDAYRQPFIGNSSLPVARSSGQTETYCLPCSWIRKVEASVFCPVPSNFTPL